MGLDKQVVSIPLQAGVDLENNSVLVGNDRFIELQNVVFDKGALGQLHKRNGYTALTSAISTEYGGVVRNGQSLVSFNNELGLVSAPVPNSRPSQFYTLPPSLDKWVNRGPIPNILPTETQIYSGAMGATNSDTASLNGISVFAYELNGAVGLKVLDEASKSVYYQTADLFRSVLPSYVSNLTIGSYAPKCIVVGSIIAVFLVGVNGSTSNPTTRSGELYVALINPSVPQAVPSAYATTIVPAITQGTNEAIYDVCHVGTSLVAVVSQGSSLVVTAINTTTWQPSSPGTLPIGLTVTALCACAMGTASTTHVFIGAVVENNFQFDALAFVFDTSINDLVTGVLPLATASANAIARLTCMPYQTANALVLWETTNPTPSLQQVNCAVVFTGTIAPTFQAVTGVSLCSQPFLAADRNIYFLVQFVSSVQPTLFLMALPYPVGSTALPYVAGKYLPGSAGGPPTNNRMPAFQQTASGVYETSVSDIVEELSVSDALQGLPGVTELSVTFGTGTISGQQLGQNLHLGAGSLLWNYDGTNLTEHGFNVYPEAPVVTLATSAITVVYNNIDPTVSSGGQPNSPLSISINIPDNVSQPGGAVGNLITPGEYIAFNQVVPGAGAGTNLPAVVYFIVDGVGSAPSSAEFPSPWVVTPVVIASKMTATQVANALYGALTAALDNWTITYALGSNPPSQRAQVNAYTVQTITLTSTNTTYFTTIPAGSRQFTVFQACTGAVNQPCMVSITGTPASLIENGQYFTFISTDTLNHVLQGYFWFTIGETSAAAVEAADPNPYNITNTSGGFSTVAASSTLLKEIVLRYRFSSTTGNLIGINVNLSGTEDAAGVVAAISNAILTVQNSWTPPAGGVNWGINSQVSGNALMLSSQDLTVFSILPANYANNPATGGVQQNYVGQNLTQVDNFYAAEQYVAVYEWIDDQGQLHQSAPSVPTTVNIPVYTSLGSSNAGNLITAGALAPNAAVTIDVNPLTLTLKSNVDVAIYRTTTDGQVFYRVTSPLSPIYNQPQSIGPLTYLDTASDLSIESNQPLYTTGDVLENDAPPATGIMVNHQDRLWVVDAEDPTLWWFSEQFSKGYGVIFSSLQTVRVNPSVGNINGGNIVAGASMDGNLISLQSNLLQYISGTGPDDTGVNGSFSTPQLVASSTSIGCRDPGSVVLTPGGLMFKSTQGYYMLARGLTLNYVGAPVKAFNADVVTAATALDTNTQVRFLSETGTTLVFDWFYNAWGTFTNHQGISSLSFGNQYYYINSGSGLVYQEAPGVYADDGVGFGMLVTTAWLKAANIQGFQRVWKLFVEGWFSGTQQYQVQLAYDYNPSVVDTLVLNGSSSSTGVWGYENPWGNGVWGGSGAAALPDRRQFRVFPSSQLCEAIQMTWTDLAPYNVTVTPALNALDIEVGIRRGGYKRLGPGGSIG